MFYGQIFKDNATLLAKDNLKRLQMLAFLCKELERVVARIFIRNCTTLGRQVFVLKKNGTTMYH